MDGSNVQTVFSKSGVGVWNPTYSPDGGRIAVEMRQTLGDGEYDGIAILQADGTNVLQLTGKQATSNGCIDEFPC